MKKGFTLVELLAVIAVLALIAIITVPIVSDTIDKNEQKALERSKDLYLKSVEKTIVEKNIGNVGIYEVKECTINNDGNLLCDNSTEEIVIEVNGNRPNEGKIKFQKGKIVSYALIFGDKEFSYRQIEIVNDTTYPWIVDGENYKSSNHSHNSTSNLTFEFELYEESELSFDWSVSGENCCDYIYYTIKKDGVVLSGTGTSTILRDSGYGTSESSLVYKKVSKILEPGKYELIFTYRKDGSVNAGADAGYVKNVELN